MISKPIHVIDFEGSRQSGVVEYGVVTLVGQTVMATYSRICAPVGTISDWDRAQHGITEEFALREEPFTDDWRLFSELRQQGPFCAHNVAVESGLIESVWPYPKACPNFADPGLSAANWGPWLDTLQLYRRIYPGLESYRLEKLVGLFSVQENLDRQARLLCPPKRRCYHCALYDALASAFLLARLFDEPGIEDVSLRWLILESAASQSSRDAMGQQELF